MQARLNVILSLSWIPFWSMMSMFKALDHCTSFVQLSKLTEDWSIRRTTRMRSCNERCFRSPSHRLANPRKIDHHQTMPQLKTSSTQFLRVLVQAVRLAHQNSLTCIRLRRAHRHSKCKQTASVRIPSGSPKSIHAEYRFEWNSQLSQIELLSSGAVRQGSGLNATRDVEIVSTRSLVTWQRSRHI